MSVATSSKSIKCNVSRSLLPHVTEKLGHPREKTEARWEGTKES